MCDSHWTFVCDYQWRESDRLLPHQRNLINVLKASCVNLCARVWLWVNFRTDDCVCVLIDNHSRRRSNTKMASVFDNVLLSSFADNGQFEKVEIDTPRRIRPVLQGTKIELEIYRGTCYCAVQPVDRMNIKLETIPFPPIPVNARLFR